MIDASLIQNQLFSKQGLRKIVSTSVGVVSSLAGLATLVAFGVAVALFYSLEWQWLRHALGSTLMFALDWTGRSVTGNALEFFLAGRHYNITAECTYVDWILCAAPFIWRFNCPVRANCFRLALLAMLGTAANFARVYVAVVLNSAGVSWFWCHDMVDYILWYPGLTVVIVFWLAALSRRHRACVKELSRAD